MSRFLKIIGWDTFGRKLPLWALGIQLLFIVLMGYGLINWVEMPLPKLSLNVPYIWMILIGACGYLVMPFFFTKVNKNDS